jgi:hypothetical protein
MQQRLPLPTPAIPISLFAIRPKLRDMPSKRDPPPNLPLIILAPPPPVIPAIPLKPPARIIAVNPALLLPIRKRLRRIHPKKVQPRVVPLMTQLRIGKPAPGKLLPAIRHILPAEDPQLQHFHRRQLRPKEHLKIPPRRLHQFIHIPPLHQIIHFNPSPAHGNLSDPPLRMTSKFDLCAAVGVCPHSGQRSGVIRRS